MKLEKKTNVWDISNGLDFNAFILEIDFSGWNFKYEFWLLCSNLKFNH